MADTLTDFYIAEGIRQDRLIHDLASTLATKAGFYMVVAGFVFSAEATLLQNAEVHGFTAWKPSLLAALLCALIGIMVLLRTVFLRLYSMPPLLGSFKQQWDNHVKSVGTTISDENQVVQIKEVFVVSLAEVILHNDAANQSVADTLRRAALLIQVSILLVFISVFVGIMRWVFWAYL